MQHVIGQPKILSATAIMLLLPKAKALLQLVVTPFNGISLKPLLNGVLFELQKDALAAILIGWKPSSVNSELRTLHCNVQLALDVGTSSFKSRKSYLSNHFAQPVNKYNALDGIHRNRSRPGEQ